MIKGVNPNTESTGVKRGASTSASAMTNSFMANKNTGAENKYRSAAIRRRMAKVPRKVTTPREREMALNN
jgi:hypothetical protein